jgi:hypothetical protein
LLLFLVKFDEFEHLDEQNSLYLFVSGFQLTALLQLTHNGPELALWIMCQILCFVGVVGGKK